MRLGTKQSRKEKVVYYELKWIFKFLFISFLSFFLSFILLSSLFLVFKPKSYLYHRYCRPAWNPLFNWDNFQVTTILTPTDYRLSLQFHATIPGLSFSIEEFDVEYGWEASVSPSRVQPRVWGKANISITHNSSE